MTLASLLWFAVIWLKYEVTPEPLRYFWWVVWSHVRVAAHAVHRRLVLQGAHATHAIGRRKLAVPRTVRQITTLLLRCSSAQHHDADMHAG